MLRRFSFPAASPKCPAGAIGALAVNRIQHFQQRSQHRAADLKNTHRAETADAAERPHEALAMAVPADRYRPSTRAFPEHPAPPEYAPGETLRKVQDGGLISFRGREFRICKAFKGHRLALRPTNTDGV